jgi:bifunctional DNase/RNase
MLGELDVDVVRVTVTELRENTFHASITIAQNGAEVEIDSRSSDAIAIAVRAQAPIFAADEVIEESAIEMEGDEVNEEEIVDEFKRFLDKVSAEDFIEAEVEGDVEDAEVEPDDDDEERDR